MSLVSEALKQLQNKQNGPSGFSTDNSAIPEPSGFYSASAGPGKKVIIALALGAVMITALLMSLGIFLALYLYFPAEQRVQPKPEDPALATPETEINTDLTNLEPQAPAVAEKAPGETTAVAEKAPGETTAEDETSRAEIHDRYRVTMIMKGGSSAMAIINGRTVEIGDRLSDSSIVVDIQPRHIVIEENGERYRLTPESSR